MATVHDSTAPVMALFPDSACLDAALGMMHTRKIPPIHNLHAKSRVIEPRATLQTGHISRREWVRFMQKVNIDTRSKHWLWQGKLTKGYGRFSWRGKDYGAHRFAYIALRANIPADRQPDHLCRIPACVNPDCLEPVTSNINTLRGNSIVARHAKMTHCKRGHLFDEWNTLYIPYVRTNGEKLKARRCKTCNRMGHNAAYKRKRDATRQDEHRVVNQPS